MRSAPTSNAAQGGRATSPRWLVAADGNTEAARVRQRDELPWQSIRETHYSGAPGKLRGAFVPAGGFPVPAKTSKTYGASGLSFEVAAVEMTADGLVPWSEYDKPDKLLRPIKPRRVKTMAGRDPVEGQTGFLVRAAKTGTLDNLLLLPTEATIISHWYGDKANRRSSRVYDVDAKGKLDQRRNGPIDFITVVAMSAVRKEFIPVLNGSPDAPRQAVSGPTSDVSVFFGTQNSGGGVSTRPGDAHRFTRVVPVYDPSSDPVDPTGDRTGSTTTTSGGGYSGGAGAQALRYTDTGPKGNVHLGQVGAAWMVDAETCTLHRYATTLDIGPGGAGTRHHECPVHYEVGPNTGIVFKVRGSATKDSPLKFDLADWTGIPTPGRMIETFIRHDPKDSHIHRGVKKPGLWRVETPCPTPPVITSGPPKIGGGPVDPNCLTAPMPMQMSAVAPLPKPNAYGSATLMQAVDCFPLDASAYNDANFARISKAPWCGANYGWAQQDADGQFTQRRNGKPWNPGGKPASVGGFLRLPAGISPECRGSSADYERPRQGDVFTREDIAHYKVSDSIARPNPVLGKGVDGIRTGQITGSAGNRTFGSVCVDADGNEGASATGVYRMRDQMRLSRGTKATVVIASGSITPANAYDHDVLPESPGPNDTLTTIDATNAEDGDELRLWFPVGTQTVNETGNLLIAGTTWNAVAPDNITFRWDASASKWHEVARVDH